MPTIERPPLPVLTSLRFFAAAEVVVFHAMLPWQTNIIRGLTSAGYQAVTFFFVLSGFILTYVYAGTPEQPTDIRAINFWKARFARTAPAYFLGLLIAAPALVYSATVSKTLPTASILGLTATPLFLQAWWPAAAVLWNPPAWSLSVEYFFYAVFPLALSFAPGRSSFLRVAIAYYLIVAMAFLRWKLATPDAPIFSAAYNFDLFFPPFHLPQFLFGIVLGHRFLFGPPLSHVRSAVLFWAGLFGIIFIFGARSALPEWTQTEPILAPLFGLIIFGGARASALLEWLALPAMTTLGEASYALYILHLPIAFWWGVINRRLLSLSPFVSFSIYFGMTVAASVLCFLYIETPARRWIQNRKTICGPTLSKVTKELPIARGRRLDHGR